MLQLLKNIRNEFLGQIFPELFQFKTRSFFLGNPVGQSAHRLISIMACRGPGLKIKKDRFCYWLFSLY